MHSRIPSVPSAGRRDPAVLALRFARRNPFHYVFHAVNEVASRPDADAIAVARVVERDADLSRRLLRLANSASSALSRRCISVRHAAALLGTKRVRDVVASAAALAFMERHAQRQPELLAHSTAVAGVARTLAPWIGVSPDDAFTAGLLHDIGTLALLREREAADAAAPSRLAGGVSTDTPRGHGAVDHAILGAEILRRWGLPEACAQVAELHHDWRSVLAAKAEVVALAGAVMMASELVDRLLADEAPGDDVVKAIGEHAIFVHFRITEAWIRSQWGTLRRACNVDSLLEDTPRPSLVPTVPVPVQKPQKPSGVYFQPEDLSRWVMFCSLILAVSMAMMMRLA